MTWRLRCPDCGDVTTFHSETSARTAQRRVPCPDCDRMRGLSNVRVGREVAL